jgi:hypothetical protein
MTILRIHKDIFPHSDHGYTWVECYWYERDGQRISAITPGAGCNERLGAMPGGAIMNFMPEDNARFQPERTVKSEKEHAGYYKIGTCSIVRSGD